MTEEAMRPGAVFPLANIEAGLDGFVWPRGAFDPGGAWRHVYRMCTLTRDCAKVGEVRVAREPASSGARLSVAVRHAMPGRFEFRLDAEIACRADALASPQAWRLEAETRDAAGAVIPHTRIAKHGRAADEGFCVEDAVSRRTIRLAAPYTVRWALFDAVQRLPREPFPAIAFTLLDDFDQPKPRHRLSHRESAAVLLGEERVRQTAWENLERGRVRKTRWKRQGGEAVRLTAFDHVGAGVVPWVYWVDGQGRLLFAVSGIEAYILEPGED